jgi:ABC-type dipeptide/oligopeptide/nickel transport system permease component
MLNYVARRIFFIPVSLLIVTFAAFIVLRMTADPVELFVSIDAPPEQRELIAKELHLDKPLPVQYGYFLLDVARGDFGRSLQFGAPAMPIVVERLGATIQLVSLGVTIAVLVGVLGGMVCAIRKDRITDFIVSSLAVGGQSMPSFWLGLLLIQFFALHLGWLPTSGSGSFRHVILPAVTQSVYLLPNFVLLTRTSFLETMNEQYVVTARSKGASETAILFRHVLPNAINPVLSFLGLQVGRLMGGSIITESIFAWPGVGRLMIGSIFQRDVPVVLACVFVLSIAIIIANLVVDIVLSIIDPRIRLK